MRRNINLNTLSSLQILQSESHPNAFNQGPGQTSSRAKESFSLYGLFCQHVLTPQGKSRLRQCFLRPSIDMDIIRERQVLIDIFLRPDNDLALHKLCSSMKNIKNIRPILTNLHKGLSSGKGAFGGPKGTVWGTILTVSLFSGCSLSKCLHLGLVRFLFNRTPRNTPRNKLARDDQFS